MTFYTFANFAKWETTYIKDGKKYSYVIDIDSATLENYFPSEEHENAGDTGTTVVFSEIISADLTPDMVRIYLAQEFCWFLELNQERGNAIYVNGEKLDYSMYVSLKEEQTYVHAETGTSFSVRYICWKRKLAEYSKYYYLKADGSEIAKENTTLNNKGDRFYHSVYIQSSFFDNFDFNMSELSQISMGGLAHKKTPAYEYIMHEVNSHLIDLRRPLIMDTVSKVVDSLEIEAAFPNYSSRNVLDVYRKTQISEMISAIYIAQPKIFTNTMNKEQKKTFIRLLDLIMQSGEINALFNIFNEILDMTEAERNDLAGILRFTHMSNITKTIKLIRDRYQAVEALKQLVFNPNLHANEVQHLQKMIEQHYWLFGEQYNLVTAAEPNFEQALRRYLKYLQEEYEDASVEHPDKLKQMDIFAVRQDISYGKFHNVVVELKHPNIALGEKQLSQVKKYMRVIQSVPRFDADNMSWEFYLVGNKFSQDGFIEGEIENNRHHGEPHLVFKTDRYKVFVMRWGEVIAEFEKRHSYLNERLCLERDKLQKDYSSADEVILAQGDNSAIMPKEMAQV